MSDLPSVEETTPSPATPPILEAETLEKTQRKLRFAQADATIANHVAIATGTGFLPVPVFDIVAATGVQADLIRKLFQIYGYEVSKEKARSIVTVLLGASLPTLTARAFASGLKFIPAVGTGLAFFAAPSLAGASTLIVGTVVRDHLASGGNLLDLKMSKAKAKVRHELSRAKAGTSHIYEESKERLGNAADALKGKKATANA